MNRILETERLILRPLVMTDAPTIRALAGEYQVARMTLNIPHPYPEGAAEAFIQARLDHPENGYVFGIVRKVDQQLMGAIGIHPEPRFNRAEIGYWLGIPYWNQGSASEAARRVVAFGFAELKLNRIYASYFTHNPASRRVMEKAGMTYEGTLRQHIIRDGAAYDLGYCGILRSEWEAS
ncbi:MAG: GNAT family N-acetyltransferase [Chloroflexi bacterium]|nr:GNAT family N-acetyltransferase [Chloroflexota bacterium]